MTLKSFNQFTTKATTDTIFNSNHGAMAPWRFGLISTTTTYYCFYSQRLSPFSTFQRTWFWPRNERQRKTGNELWRVTLALHSLKATIENSAFFSFFQRAERLPRGNGGPRRKRRSWQVCKTYRATGWIPQRPGILAPALFVSWLFNFPMSYDSQGPRANSRPVFDEHASSFVECASSSGGSGSSLSWSSSTRAPWRSNTIISLDG